MELDFTSLPDLPQVETLKQFAPEIWRNKEVRALWVEGSLALGTADRYSDVDLRLAVPATRLPDWATPDLLSLFEGRCVAHQRLFNQEEGILHHLMLDTGDMYDMGVQKVQRVSLREACRVLGCRDPELAVAFEKLAPASATSLRADPNPDTIRQVIVDFWLNTNKHRKVLYRGLDPMVIVGLQTERTTLLRLWTIHDSGRDSGTGRPTIHTLTPQVRSIGESGRNALEVLGAPAQTRVELLALIELHRDEVSRVGRKLADRYAFSYPEAVEATVRACWDEYMSPER